MKGGRIGRITRDALPLTLIASRSQPTTTLLDHVLVSELKICMTFEEWPHA